MLLTKYKKCSLVRNLGHSWQQEQQKSEQTHSFFQLAEPVDSQEREFLLLLLLLGGWSNCGGELQVGSSPNLFETISEFKTCTRSLYHSSSLSVSVVCFLVVAPRVVL